MTRPLRSLLIGDCDHYFSPYIFGVAQACARLGIWHTQISIRSPAELIAQRVHDVRPDLLWTHMLLWAPEGSPPRDRLLEICALARRLGAFVVLHDGDVKERTRHPENVSGAIDLALLNHAHDRSAWGIPAIRWPYAAFPQDRIADPVPALACDVAFAGQLGTDAIYAPRTAFLDRLGASGLRLRIYDAARDGNTMLRTPEIAASATTVIGMGRAAVKSWVDTRVFQYSSAGAILLHDDVGGYLEPWVHYVPYRDGDAESAADAVCRVQRLGPDGQMALRQRAFDYGQANHSYIVRVKQVLGVREGGP